MDEAERRAIADAEAAEMAAVTEGADEPEVNAHTGDAAE